MVVNAAAPLVSPTTTWLEMGVWEAEAMSHAGLGSGDLTTPDSIDACWVVSTMPVPPA